MSSKNEELEDVAEALNSMKIKAKVGKKISLQSGGNVDWTKEIKVEINDPDSPLYSKCVDFKELQLNKKIIQGLDSMNFYKPSYIQEVTLPMIITKPYKNLIAQSQSGTGKTVAFCLGILAIINENERYPQAICLSPTRELTDQTYNVIKKMGEKMEVGIILAIPTGVRYPRGHRITDQIIIGTVGTIQNWIQKNFFDPKNIKIIVFDEADQMLTGTTSIDSMKIKRKCLNIKQILLFSATFNEDVSRFALEILGPNTNKVLLKPNEIAVKKIRQFCLKCNESSEKYELLKSLYECLTLGSVIIFVNTAKTVIELRRKMIDDGHSVTAIHGKLEDVERKKIMSQFREGKSRVLISTNLLARGIDVEHVNVVINYDIPWDYEQQRPDIENYIHRIGRCGRFGRRGIALNFIHNEESKVNIETICNSIGVEIITISIDDEEEIEKILNL